MRSTRLGPWIVAALLVIGLWRWYQGRDIEHPPGVVAPDDPVQVALEDEDPISLEGYQLRPRASFSATVRVLGREDYSIDALADLVPTDFAVGWGPMSDSQVLAEIDISQGNRFYYWYTKSWPIDRQDIETHSANWHLIPADAGVRSQLKRVRRGSVVELEGQLVDIDGPKGQMRTSLRRNDTGAGACEILYTTSVRIVTPG